MEFTKNQVFQAIKDRDIWFFKECRGRDDDEVTEVWYMNHGDGNEMYSALHFIKLDIYVLMQGTYSSWGDSSWDKVVLAEPYEFRETRYRKINLPEIVEDEEEPEEESWESWDESSVYLIDESWDEDDSWDEKSWSED